jgi:Tfp pilus assembly protein PilF
VGKRKERIGLVAILAVIGFTIVSVGLAVTVFWLKNQLPTSVKVITEKEPSAANVAAKNGNDCLKRQAWAPAIRHFSEAIQFDPKSPRAFLGRGLAYEGKREWEKALADYTEAIRLAPKWAGPS